MLPMEGPAREIIFRRTPEPEGRSSTGVYRQFDARRPMRFQTTSRGRSFRFPGLALGPRIPLRSIEYTSR